MANRPAAADEQRRVVTQLMDEFISRIDAGEPLDIEEFLSDHPEHAPALRKRLADAELQQRLDQASSSHPDPTNRLAESTQDEASANTVVQSADDAETSVTRQYVGPTESSKTQIEIPESFGRYAIKKVLGQGAMGAVYLARDTQLDRDVALKIPKFRDGNGVDDEELLERFYREARASATLRSPNICPVHDVGEINGQHYITMAYIEGRPLKDFTRSKKSHSEKQIATTIRKLALGLSEAHAIGVIHRDLKPANIMVDTKGEPVVMDFGLARRNDSDDVQVTQSGAILGTPAYMAPEQVAGEQAEITHQVDIYALGVIMYELITGEMPYKGNLMSLLQQISIGNAKKPSELRNGLDPRLEKICLKMMAKDPKKRYQSMNDVAADLHKVLRHPNRQQKAEAAGKTGPKPAAIPTSQEESNPALISVEQPKSFAEQLREKKGKATSKASRSSTHLKSATAAASSGQYRKWLMAGGAGGLAVLLGIVFLVRVGKYDVQITLDDPSITLSVDGEVLNIQDGQDVYKLSAGEHKLQLEKDGLKTHVEDFTVSKDGRTALRAVVVNGKLDGLLNGEQLPTSLTAKPVNHVSNVQLSRGLVGHWGFEEAGGTKVFDASGNQNHGSLTGETSWKQDAPPSPLAGKSSLRFESGLMTVPFSTALNVSNQMAIAFWCKLDADAPGRSFIENGPFHISNGHQRILLSFQLSGDEPPTSRHSGESKPLGLFGGQWNHVAVNCTGQHVEFWYNGRLMNTQPIEGQIQPVQQEFKFGRELSGSMDDFRFYQRSLLPEEIETLANIPVGQHAVLASDSSIRSDRSLFTNPSSSTAEWTSLFDGKSTTGWADLSTFRVVRGELVADKKGLAASAEQYEDFELEFEWAIAAGGNGGVYYREHTPAQGGQTHDLEYQLLDNQRHPNGKKPITTAGSLYGKIAPQVDVTRPVGQWNVSRIVCQGDHVEHWLNGTKLLEFSPSKIDPPHQQTRGYIYLQSHTSQVKFKSIRIRSLPHKK